MPWVAALLVAGVSVAGPVLNGWNPVRTHEPRRLAVRVIVHPRQQVLVPELEKRVESPKKKKKIFDARDLRKKVVKRHGRVRRHRPRKRVVPRKVFGVTRDSVTKGKSPVAVRVGNTLMKAPEKVYKPPAKQEAPASSRARGVFGAGDVERPPRFVYRAVPKYPEEAEEDEVEGVVTVWVVVDTRGRPAKVERVEGPRRDLDLAAKRAALQSRFLPALYRSKPVMCRVRIPYRFRLE